MIVIPRNQHTISRRDISDEALKVLYRLHNSGYAAFLVGGCVRDLLLGRHPKDFDVATNAEPEQVHKLFRNCRLIGRRFRLAHIVFGKKIIEVATFRARHLDLHAPEGMVIRDNVYGTIEDDAWRRDFTVNALYYNIADFTVVDYTGGMQDLQEHRLRMIGEPQQRFQEDPVRLLRAIRFAGKLAFDISPETAKHILPNSNLLQNVSSSRLYQEVLKILQEGYSLPIFRLLQQHSLLEQLFPQTAAFLHDEQVMEFLERALQETDERIKEAQPISASFVFTVFLWYPILHYIIENQNQGMHAYVAHERAVRLILNQLKQRLSIPKQIQIGIQEICLLQYRLAKYKRSYPTRVTRLPRFRAAYDLLQLRKAVGEDVVVL